MRSILIILITLIATAIDTNADNSKEVENFINKTANQVIMIAGNENYTTKQKVSGMMRMMQKNFNVHWMGKFVLGRGYLNLTPEEQRIYYKQYEKYLLYSYLPNLFKYSNETFKINNVIKTGNYDYTVETSVIRHDGNPPIKINYHVKQSKKNPNSFKIIDIVAEGISAILSQRSEFGEIIQQSGVKGLIHLIEQKNIQFDKEYS